jgi:hypothetical protein
MENPRSLSLPRKRGREGIPFSLGEASRPSPVSSDESSPSDEETPYLIDDESCCRPTKRVRFSTSVDGKILVSESTARTSSYFVSSLPSASLSKADLWWSKEDRDCTIQECVVVINEFRVNEDHREEMQMFTNVHEKCLESPSHASSDCLMEQGTIRMSTQIRGLEWGVAPKLKARRKAHIRDVLDVQSRIQNLRDREKFVSSRSMTSSRPSRIIARMIGEGDALTVKTMDQTMGKMYNSGR